MHCKKLRSEYMKRFKNPQWEAYGKCYEELLQYRVTRRLLEHVHNPWLWEGWEEASDSSSGNSTPQKPPDSVPASPKPQGTEGDAKDVTLKQPGPIKQPTETEGPGSRNAIPKDIPRQEIENKEDGTSEERTEVKNSTSHVKQPQNHSVLLSQDGQKSIKIPPRIDLSREVRHPFAMYACGEKKKDTGSQKTHNVCAPTQENEIYESALRAKNRRQKDKRKQILHRQRARSADTERFLRREPSPVDNPWMTEYMRCYSARTR
ncbi:hypothetical protein FKM82_010698 [Ascaphus truei]